MNLGQKLANSLSISEKTRKRRFLHLFILMSCLFLFHNENFVEHNVLSQALPNVNIDGNGNSSTSIPIVVPSGSGGITPGLSINYNSSNGFGLLGIGWDLSGIHTIGRNPSYRISYDDSTDHYISSMAGELVKKKDSSTIYFSKNESFAKYERSGGVWKMKDKQGTTYQFGKQLTTTIADKNHGIPGGKTKLWVLDKVTGLKEKNTYEITYHDDSQDHGYPYPLLIYYNNNSDSNRSEISFEYYNFDPTTGETCRDCFEKYSLGGFGQKSKLLKSIVIKNQDKEVNRYEFVYDNDKRKLIRVKRKAYGLDNYKDISIAYTKRKGLNGNVVLDSKNEDNQTILTQTANRQIDDMNFSYFADEETYVDGWGERALCNAGYAICVQTAQWL